MPTRTKKQRDSKGRYQLSSKTPKNLLRKTRASREIRLRYQQMFSDAVSEGDWEHIIRTAVIEAIQGDRDARKWLSDNLIGLPVVRIAPTDPEGENPYNQMTDEALKKIALEIVGPNGNPPVLTPVQSQQPQQPIPGVANASHVS